MGRIHLRDALTLMDARDANGRLLAFDCEHYTYNRKTKEGGQKQVLEGVRLNVPDAHAPQMLLRGGKPHARNVAMEPRRTALGLVDGRSRPQHFANTTRDVLLHDGAVHRFNIFLLTRFNGDEVTL